jgi:hypothetical protein
MKARDAVEGGPQSSAGEQSFWKDTSGGDTTCTASSDALISSSKSWFKRLAVHFNGKVGFLAGHLHRQHNLRSQDTYRIQV